MQSPAHPTTITGSAPLIVWRHQDGGWEGRGPSGTLWSILLQDRAWVLGNDNCARIADAPESRPLVDAALASEAMWIATHGGSLTSLPLEFLLKARAFATLQREALIAEMRQAGFDPAGVEGPREDWMVREIVAAQAAIDGFERAAVDRGWRPTNGR